MKRFISAIISLFILLIVFSTKVNAFQFEKTTDNPLPISYFNNYNSQLQANVLKEADIYKGVFAVKRDAENYYSLGYFESIDGISWQMKKEILSTGNDLSNPRILKTQTGYTLFVTRYDNNSIYRIYSSSCDFNFNCSLSLTPAIFPDVSNNSEKNGVFAGFPYQQDSRTYLFFGAWGGDGFKLKLAYSDNLINWQRCPGDKSFLPGGDGPFVYKLNNDLYLFFHRSDSSGIKLAKSVLPLSCDSIFEDQGYLLIKDRPYDQNHLIFPSIINNNDGLRLYYSGLGTDNRWRLNIACTGQACLTPAATPTPTLTPVPTLTPTPTSIPEKTPLIVIPGFMASWNREAILHNKAVSYNDWKLLSFVKDYVGLINTLKMIGYQEDVDLFIFAYDWRQSIEKTANDLNSYLQTKIWNNKPNQKINLIGHSLGGLTARIFTQKNTDKVNKIISVGSPHLGTVQVYKPLEAGEIDRANTFLWLAKKMVLILNKSTIESDRITIANKFPVAKDLFPVFNFLKDSQGNEISIDNLTIKNSFLVSYNQNFLDIFPIFTAIYGEKDNNTPAGYIVEPQNSLDQLLGNYSDGKPKKPYFDLGDYMILSNSARQDADSEKLYFDHGEIITKKDAIKKVLSLLNINFSDDQILEGQVTKISSSLIFLIKSPATMTVEFNNQTYQEEEGVIFIPDAQSGNYNLKIQGTNLGAYTVHIGQISENNDIWEKIDGNIIQSPASSQIDDYSIDYNNQTAFSLFPTPTIIPTVIPTITPSPIPTILPTLTPTTVPQLISSSSSTNSSSNNQSLRSADNNTSISQESSPEVLGISSNEEELIAPIIKTTKQTEVKKEIKKISSIWNYVWLLIISLILVGIGWLSRKKLFKK